jgi:hypothetical protein
MVTIFIYIYIKFCGNFLFIYKIKIYVDIKGWYMDLNEVKIINSAKIGFSVKILLKHKIYSLNFVKKN